MGLCWLGVFRRLGVAVSVCDPRRVVGAWFAGRLTPVSASDRSRKGCRRVAGRCHPGSACRRVNVAVSCPAHGQSLPSRRIVCRACRSAVDQIKLRSA